MIVKEPTSNYYPNSWNIVTAIGILTQVLNYKTHQVEEAITILFSNGLVIDYGEFNYIIIHV